MCPHESDEERGSAVSSLPMSVELFDASSFVSGRACARVSVGIPTWGRGVRVFETLDRLAACDPPPAEVIVHVDGSSGELESELANRYPAVRVLSSPYRVGPGGGRHRCVMAAREPIFASFDDDSWPVDQDYFRTIVDLFELYPRTAIVAASIFQQDQREPERCSSVKITVDYVGCGYAMRVSAYRQTSGHIDRYCPYGIEEFDLALQLHALDWLIVESSDLRVFHDTRLTHHSKPEIVSGVLQNIALRAFLRYPPSRLPRALAQLGNGVFWMLKEGRVSGIAKGLCGIPELLRKHSKLRQPVPAEKVDSYLDARPRRQRRRGSPRADTAPTVGSD